MDPTGGRDSRYINYSMSIGLSMSDNSDIYGNTSSLIRPTAGIGQPMNRNNTNLGGLMNSNNNNSCVNQTNNNNNNNNNSNNNNNNINTNNNNHRGLKRTNSDCYDDHHRTINSQGLVGGGGLDGCTGTGGTVLSDVVDDSYTTLQKKSPPANGKKTKGRVKIKMEYIDNKLRRYTTFSKRKTGIMKKAYELSTLTGTQVMLLVASETGHVYTFATRKLQPMITSEAGKQLIQTCLNSPDPPSGAAIGDQRMSATGFEETELSYNIGDEDSKDDRSPMSSGESGDESSGIESPVPSNLCNNVNKNNNNTTSNSQILNSMSMNMSDQHKIQSSSSISSSLSSASSSSSSSSSSLSVANTPIASTITISTAAATGTPISTKITTTTPVSGSSSSSSAASFKGEYRDKKNVNQNINSVLYPAAAIANLPQEVLLNLVQTGQLQIHQEEDGSQQYITIPLSMMPGGLGKVTIKNPIITTNGKDSPLKEVIIKEENIE